MLKEIYVQSLLQRHNWTRDKHRTRLLWDIARRSARLLDHPIIFPDLAAITQHCRNRLIAADLTQPSGRLRITDVTQAAQNRLAALRELYPELRSMAWLVAMGRKHRRAFSPFQHLLLDIVTSGKTSMIKPARKPISKRHLLADDPEFEARMRKAAVEAKSLRAAARQVGVDPKTILRHAERLDLKGPWIVRPRAHSPKPDPEAEIKRRWQKALKRGSTRTELRRHSPADWVWLKRHCPDWLEAHSPKPMTRSSKGHSRINWPELDAKLSDAIRKAALEIRTIIPPCRITQSEIERKLGRPQWFGPRWPKLPICKATFKTVVETLNGFRIRRIEWARKTLIDQGIEPSPWRLSRLAGLPKTIPQPVKHALIHGGPQ